MKKIISLFLTLVVFVSLIAQDLTQYIPSDAVFVANINPKNIDSKVSLESLKKLDVFEAMANQLSQMGGKKTQEAMYKAINAPSQYGMDFMSKSYFFIEMKGENTFANFIFKLSDRQKFENFFKTEINKDNKTKIETKSGFTMVEASETGTMAWNDKMVLISVGYFNFDYKNGEKYEDYKIRATTTITDQVHSFFTTSPKAPIIKNKNYAKSILTKNDAHMWVDYGRIMQSYGDIIKSMPGVMPSGWESELMNVSTAMMDLYKDMKVASTINFVDGAMEIDIRSYTNKKMLDYTRKVYDNKLNKKFLKYLDGSNLLGYFSMAFNVENMFEGMKDLYYPIIESSTNKGQMITSALDVMEIFVDNEAIYNLFKGDMLFAITGLQEYETTYIGYDFDDDFNRIEVEKTKKETLPSFIMMMSYGDEKNINKLLKFGVKSEVFERVKPNLLKVVDSLSYAEMPIYLVKQDGILFLTNDTNITMNNLVKGRPIASKVNKEHINLIRKKPMTFYWDIPKTLSNLPIEVDGNSTDSKMLNMSKNTFESIKLTYGRPTNDYVPANLSFTLGNKKVNALEQFMDYVNDMYISMTNNRSM